MYGLNRKTLDMFIDYHGIDVASEVALDTIYKNRNLHGRYIGYVPCTDELVVKGFITVTPSNDEYEYQLLIQQPLAIQLYHEDKDSQCL